MQRFADARGTDTGDEFWLTEHPPIYTLGLAGRPEHVLRDNGIPILKVDRGGQVTYHGPGQLVAYTLVDLRRARLGVRDMVRKLEGAVIEWLSTLGIDAYGKVDAPGVYVARGRYRSEACRARPARAPALHLSRARGQRRDESRTLHRHRSVRLSRPRGDPARGPGRARTVAQAGDELVPFLQPIVVSAKGRPERELRPLGGQRALASVGVP